MHHPLSSISDSTMFRSGSLVCRTDISITKYKRITPLFILLLDNSFLCYLICLEYLRILNRQFVKFFMRLVFRRRNLYQWKSFFQWNFFNFLGNFFSLSLNIRTNSCFVFLILNNARISFDMPSRR